MASTETDRAPADRGARRFLVPAVLALSLVGLGVFIYSQMGSASKGPKRQTVKIAVLPDTPPPPPPPPKEEKRPEPKPEENKPQPQEQKQVEAPPEPQQLKMEGAAGDGPSAFSAGSVSSEYKGGAVGTGTGGGTVGDRLAASSYGNAAKRELNGHLQRQRELRRSADYDVAVLVWVREDGSLERIKLVGSTGSDEADVTLQGALNRFPGFRNPPPPGLPQPISLKLTNRSVG
nr:hypothetical protein [uncultured Aquabacterium sp.]